MTTIDVEHLDVREKLAHIDQMLADHDRKRQEMKYQPILAMISGMTAGAALLAAGAALTKIMGLCVTALLLLSTAASAMSQAEKNEAMNNNVAAAISSVRAIYEKPKLPKKVVKPQTR